MMPTPFRHWIMWVPRVRLAICCLISAYLIYPTALKTAAANPTTHEPQQEVIIQARWAGKGRPVWQQQFVRITSVETWRRIWETAVDPKSLVPEVDFDHAMVLGALFPVGRGQECAEVREDAAQLYFNCSLMQTAEGEEHEYPSYTFVLVPRSRKPVVVQALRMYPHVPVVIGHIEKD